MNHAEIEYWALGVISAVTSGKRVEDARVELKAKWPDPLRAARRMAGHGNAARGDNILWLIGVDEQHGVVGVNPADLANWWPATCSHFQGPVPIVTPITVHYSNVMVLALLIETGSAPFLVRNPAFGSSSGGPIELEVPWREMTGTRTARHEDLILLLVPRLRLPVIEVLSASLVGGRKNPTGATVEDSRLGPGFEWYASFLIYVVPQPGETLVFPAHHITVTISAGGEVGELALRYHRIRPSNYGSIMDGTADLVAAGPSRLDFNASASYSGAKLPGDELTARVLLRPAGSDKALIISCDMTRERESSWTLERASIVLAS
jgi:hypothetical protein